VEKERERGREGILSLSLSFSLLKDGGKNIILRENLPPPPPPPPPSPNFLL